MATVRVQPKLHATLRALADAEHRSIGQVIEEAVDRYQKENFWKAMHRYTVLLASQPAPSIAKTQA